jgi:N-acetylmuramic acid 6-phosphate etherase
MATERIDPRFADLDTWPTLDVATSLYESQLAAVAAVRPTLPGIAAAADATAQRLGARGRLIYVGAGTSGRIGVQDGSELPPTFNWPADRVMFLLAGGSDAMMRSIEGAEDDAGEGARAIDAADVGRADVVIALAASGATPYAVAAIETARRHGALTIGIANNPDAPLTLAAEHGLVVDTGPEVIAGSTRMKAGTAQKVVLNLLSTSIMVRLGRTYGGIMVDMVPSNAKLRQRAVEIVAFIARCDADAAKRALAQADGDIKRAVLMARGFDRKEADARLTAADGRLRAAMLET